MMRPLYLLFLLFYVGANAQIKLKLHVSHNYHYEALYPVIIEQPPINMLHTEYEEYKTYYDLPLRHLQDTFRFCHFGFEDSKGLLTEYDYKVEGDVLDVFLRLKPVITEFSMELPLAKSKKIKNDSVWIKAYFWGLASDSKVVLGNKKGKKVGELFYNEALNMEGLNYLYAQKFPFDALQDGFFETYFEGIRGGQWDTFAFQKANWAQPHYLNKRYPKPHSDQEMMLLQTYFQDYFEHQRQLQEEEEKYVKLKNRLYLLIDSLEEKIEDLEYEIQTLKYGAQPRIPRAPVEVEQIYEYPEAEVFIAIEEPAKPYDETFPVFLEKMKQELIATQTCPFSGNITLSIHIDPAGRVYSSSLHCPNHAKDLQEAIIQKLEKTKWTPARRHGQAVGQSFIFSFDIKH